MTDTKRPDRDRADRDRPHRDGPAWQPDTELVHGGVLRSQFGETAEAIFLTQGYVYPSAEAAARFALVLSCVLATTSMLG